MHTVMNHSSHKNFSQDSSQGSARVSSQFSRLWQRVFVAVAMIMVVSVSQHAAATDLSQFQFVSGLDGESLENSPHGTLVVYFCGHCPGARKWMASDIKNISEARAKHQPPLQVIYVTPDLSGKKVESYAQSVGIMADTFAHDPVNKKKLG